MQITFEIQELKIFLHFEHIIGLNLELGSQQRGIHLGQHKLVATW
jgi:hypothetical protein